MKKVIILTAIILLCRVFTNKAQESIAIENIPVELLKDADFVLRYSDTYFEIASLGKGVYKKRFAVTILNSKARDEAEFSISYSKLRSVKNINATVYDAFGVPIKKLKKSDIRDYSNYDGFSVYSDSRIKYFDLRNNSYPYTVEVSYEFVYDGLMSFPSWNAQTPGEYSVQQSKLTVVTPKNYNLRTKIHNLDEPKVTSDVSSKTYTWEVNNLNPSKWEANSANSYSGYKRVFLAPSEFEMEGYTGNLSTWKSFGEWYQNLNKGRDELSTEEMSEIYNLISGITDEKEKVRVVYEYLQKNTRYVSIQLGLGGWQTFPASYVANNGFGDCKALTNYTSTVLKKIGVSSYYTLVKAGKYEKPIDSDFPSNQFNHVILCVPVEQDTVWLECTSQTNPFGYLGYFTSDRDVLVLNEKGGQIVHTPYYSADENTYTTTGSITIDKEGNGKLSLESNFRGLSYEYVDNFSSLDDKDQMKLIRNMFPINNLELNEVLFSEERNEIPTASLKVDFNARKVARVSGKRVFLVANQINRSEYVPSKVDNRSSDFKIWYERNIVDSITFNLPSGIHIEHLPDIQKIESEFGTYEVTFEKGDGFIKYYRKFRTKKGVYDKQLYNDYIKFNEDCAKADKQKVVFVKST